MNTKIKEGSIFWTLLKMNILPIVCLAFIITAFSITRFANAMNQEAKNGLVDLCNSIITMYDTVYEGEYRAVEQDGAVYLLKGENQLNGNFAIIDAIKEKTDVDVTIFYKDSRVLTTIVNANGERAIGTKVSMVVVRDVLNGKEPKFYANVSVEDEKYFAYYSPIIDGSGECIGMFFVGKPSAEVDRLVWDSVSPSIIFALIVMILTGIITIRFSRRFVNAIGKMEVFLEKVSGGELHAQLDQAVLMRTDELGEMGRHIINMQMALRELVEQDILTGLNNRRSGEKLLKKVHDTCIKEGTPFCVAIGDIDHFKRINDTYGHECGDVVLSSVSSTIKRCMRGRGVIARWGGEEFLLVFKEMELPDAVALLEEIVEGIRKEQIIYNDDTSVQITMTFGIVQGNTGKIEHIIRDADSKLYFGKNNGRNQIVQ